MANSNHAQAQKRKVNLESQLFPLSNAKTYLGRLLEKASQGEPVYIVQGRPRFNLQAVPEIEPIPPPRPAGFFKDAHTPAEIQEANLLAKASVNRPPKNLE